MSYQGTERRDTTAKGRAIRRVLELEIASGLRVEAVDVDGEVIRHIPTMTVSSLYRILGRLWSTAYSQGRGDILCEACEDFSTKLKALLAEHGVR